MQWVLASSNAGKLREFSKLLSDLQVELVTQSSLNIAPAVEDGLSFIENAIKKARHASQHSGLPALADDSGIEVDALQGAPGIYSARYAGEGASDADNIDKLLAALADVPDAQRSARFRCVIAWVCHPNDPMPLVVDGAWEGRILHARAGEGGFGYDPVFYAPEYQCAAAELTPEQKAAVSHRGQAIRAFFAKLQASNSST